MGEWANADEEAYIQAFPIRPLGNSYALDQAGITENCRQISRPPIASEEHLYPLFRMPVRFAELDER